MEMIRRCNIMSIDVEDYFQVEAFSGSVARRDWQHYVCRVEQNTQRILDLLDEYGVKGTFFVLGWVADRFPQLVRQIVERGHEPGCHSYWHRRVHDLTPEAFREDTLRAKTAIEQAAGAAVYGYRAPSFSITRESLWGLELLAELGFNFDSSIYPIRHDLYGIPDANRGPFRILTKSGPILEFPLATFRVWGGPNMPVAGGGYLRLCPYWYTKAGLRSAWREFLPVVSYIHPWELDPEQPRVRAPFGSRVRHYTNLKKTESRLRKLLSFDRFTSFRDCGLMEML